MNRFSKRSYFSVHTVWHIFSILFLIGFLCFFMLGIRSVDNTTLQEQAKSLEKAIRRSVVQCYVVEGTYPPSLDYLKEHYGLTYDPQQYYVDYTSIGSNLMPDITIIPLNQD